MGWTVGRLQEVGGAGGCNQAAGHFHCASVGGTGGCGPDCRKWVGLVGVIRLHSLCCCSLKDAENGSLAPAMNGVVVHSKLVDHFEEMLIEQADMSFLW